MKIEIILLLVWTHFFGVFIIQSDKMAQNKSKSCYWLLLHVIAYSIPFVFFGWLFAAINWVANFITDYVSSRITSKLWEKKEVHWFFVFIGFNQALHITTLILTYKYLV